MQFQRTLGHLFPDYESDPKFRDYLGWLSGSGLRTLGIVEVAAALLLLFGRLVAGTTYLPQTAAVLGVGLLTIAVSNGRWSRRCPRLVAVLSAWLGPALLMLPGESVGTDDYTMAAVALLLVTVVATIPLLPWHALVLGISLEGMYILSSRWELPSTSAHRDAHHVFLILLVLLAIGIAASNYLHRRREFEAQQESVRVAEALTGAQLRAQLAESAISIGKMAAALSHEINSPVGALLSSIETLIALTDRQLAADPATRARLQATRAELRRSIDESAARIDDVTRRLRRFVSLEEAEVKSADLNELLTDVSVLYEDEIRQARVRLEFDLEKPLPPLNCRPQLLTAAFSTLLSNAIHAVDGDGRIAIQTRGREGEVEVTIRDNGRGMSSEEAENVFDPSFKIAGGRVASGNWSLFNSRQIVYEHGGDIRLETAPGQGTTMRVTLPLA